MRVNDNFTKMVREIVNKFKDAINFQYSILLGTLKDNII